MIDCFDMWENKTIIRTNLQPYDFTIGSNYCQFLWTIIVILQHLKRFLFHWHSGNIPTRSQNSLNPIEIPICTSNPHEQLREKCNTWQSNCLDLDRDGLDAALQVPKFGSIKQKLSVKFLSYQLPQKVLKRDIEQKIKCKHSIERDATMTIKPCHKFRIIEYD